ncbi:MAG: GPW/gp25 family protein [Bacteroidota bacterium]
MKKEIDSFLGTGWSFPPVFNRFTNSVQMVSELDDIKQSIYLILETFPGERIMQPEFGCYLKRLVFEKIDNSLALRINETIASALLHFEPRVRFDKVEIMHTDELAGIIMLQINFSVIITNTRHNIVYPFYFTEGTNVSG